MRHPSSIVGLVLVALALAGGVARAQPIPPVPLPPAPTPAPPPAPEPEAAPPTPTPAPEETRPPPPVDPDPLPVAVAEPAPAPSAEAAPLAMRYPNILLAPSGHLLPAALIWSSTGVHTGGAVYSDLHVGLGDVAELGLSVTDLVRLRETAAADPEAIQPFVQASFKMGVGEDQLVRYQPAIALTFRKSFQHDQDGAKVRTAALYLVASRSLGPRFALHAGGVLWDAALREADGRELFFHDRGVASQIRPFGALEVEPRPHAQIMVELSWVPLLQRQPSRVDLSAVLAWGVRYRIGRLVAIESGVRIQGIEDANLLDAQIFGQLSWGTDKIRRAIAAIN